MMESCPAGASITPWNVDTPEIIHYHQLNCPATPPLNFRFVFDHLFQ